MLTNGKYPYPRNTAVMLFPGVRGSIVKEEEDRPVSHRPPLNRAIPPIPESWSCESIKSSTMSQSESRHSQLNQQIQPLKDAASTTVIREEDDVIRNSSAMDTRSPQQTPAKTQPQDPNGNPLSTEATPTHTKMETLKSSSTCATPVASPKQQQNVTNNGTMSPPAYERVPLRGSTRTLSRDYDINDNVSTPRRSPAVGNSPLARLRSSVTQFGGKLRRMNSSRDSSQSSLHRLSRFAASQQSLNWGWRRNRSSSQDTNGTFAPGLLSKALSMEETHRAAMTPRPQRRFDKLSLLPKALRSRKDDTHASSEQCTTRSQSTSVRRECEKRSSTPKLFQNLGIMTERKKAPKTSMIPTANKQAKKPLLYQVFHKKATQRANLPPPPTIRVSGKPPLPPSRLPLSTAPCDRAAAQVNRPLQPKRHQYPEGTAPLAESESSTVDNSPSVEFAPCPTGGTMIVPLGTNVNRYAGAAPTTARPSSNRLTTSPQLRRHKIMPKSPLALSAAQQQVYDEEKVCTTSTTSVTIASHTTAITKDQIYATSTALSVTFNNDVATVAPAQATTLDQASTTSATSSGGGPMRRHDSRRHSQLDAATEELTTIMKQLSTDEESFTPTTHQRFRDESSAECEASTSAHEMTTSARPVTISSNGEQAITVAPTSNMFHVPKATKYAQEHGASSNMILVDAHTYNSMLIDCKEMRRALYLLHKTITEGEVVNPLDGIADLISPATEHAPKSFEQPSESLQQENERLRAEVEMLRAQLSNINVRRQSDAIVTQ